MSANNIFVQRGSDAQIADLALYISKLRGDESYVQHIESFAKSDAVYAELAKDASVFLTENDKDVEGAFNLVIVLVLGAPESVLSTAVQALIDTLTKIESSKIGLKQKISLNLYNALPANSPLRYNAFVGLVNVTNQADELESLYGQLEYVDAWAKTWGIDQQTERNLYSYLSQVLLKSGEEKLALQFQLKQLGTYKEGDAEASGLAKDIVRRTIAMENYFAFEDLLQYNAIQQLKGTEEYELLDIFLNGTLASYQTFAEKKQGGLDTDADTRKMRLLSLASLGSENLSRELSYAEIAKNLQIPEEEVEMWVIDVIRAGLVEAKLDQLNKTVIVHRSIYRVFGKEQWKNLSTCLNAWKENLNEILGVVGNAKLMAAGGALQPAATAVESESK